VPASPPVAVIPLGASLPPRSSSLPGGGAAAGLRRRRRRDGQPGSPPPYLALLRMGFAVPPTVAGGAVRSYRTLSPLP